MASNVKLTKAQIDLLLRVLDALGSSGIEYRGSDYGRCRYDEDTGERYFVPGRPSEAIFHGSAADLLTKLHGQQAREIAAALRANIPAGLEALREVEGR